MLISNPLKIFKKDHPKNEKQKTFVNSNKGTKLCNFFGMTFLLKKFFSGFKSAPNSVFRITSTPIEL